MAALSLLVMVMTEDLDRVFGGWHLQSLAFAVLEGAVAVTLSLWVVAWFRRRWAHQGRLAKRASRRAYAAYVLHATILVMVSIAARPLPLPPETKFVWWPQPVSWRRSPWDGRSPGPRSSPASYEHTIGHHLPVLADHSPSGSRAPGSGLSHCQPRGQPP